MTTLEEEKYLSDRTERIRNLFTSKYCTIKAMYGFSNDEFLHCDAQLVDRRVYGFVKRAPGMCAEALQEIARRIDREKREIFRASISCIDDFRYNERI